MLLVPADVLHPRRPDEHFADEARAACDAGLGVAIVDHDALTVSGGARRAVSRVPEQTAGSVAVYRRWMLRSERHAALAEALHSGTSCCTPASTSTAGAHELPGRYPTLTEVTPRSAWTTGDDRTASTALATSSAPARRSCVTTPGR